MSQKLIVVGLGNPGKQYAKTRHNVGFMVVEALAENHRQIFRAGKGDYLISEAFRIAPSGEELVLIKPLTYMNNSGQAVRHVFDYYKLAIEQLLIISDDFQLPLGKLRLRAQGSEGGHNGLRSIINYLGAQNFARLRLGIGEVTAANNADYVLSTFSKAEAGPLAEMIQRACDAVLDVATHGVSYAMNKYN